jgi:NTE family protein
MSDNSGRRRVALVIGAGNIKCAAVLGVYSVLERAGIGVDLIAACSGGTLAGTLLALGVDSTTAEQIMSTLWTREITGLRNKRAVRQALAPKVFGFDEENFALVNDRLILERLRAAFGDKTFDDTVVPYFIMATDFHNGEKVVLHEGPLVDAVRASISIPLIFRPWRIGDRLLIDGAQSDPMPVDIAIRERADIILALGFETSYQRNVSSVSRFVFEVITVMTNNLLRANFGFQSLAHHNEMIAILPEFDGYIGAFDVTKLPQVVAAGARAMEENLPYLQSLLEAES